MFNINEHTTVVGVENVRSIAHLQHQLYADKTAKVDYSYYGTHVTRGTVRVSTADGPVLVDFNAKDGWAKSITIRKDVAHGN